MADSVRERIVQAAVAAIDGPARPDELVVHRFATRPIQQEQSYPAVAVFKSREASEPATLENVELRVLTWIAELRVKTRPGDFVEEDLDPIETWVERAVMADPTLGGLAFETEVAGRAWDAVETDVIYGACQISFETRYYVDRADPETGAP